MFKRWFQRWVLARRWATFIVLGLSFLAFGAGSLNLFFVFKANVNLLFEHGWMAVMDGGLQQLIELLITGYASMAAYVIFKACEYRLVHWLGEEPHSHSTPSVAHTSSTPSASTLHEDRHPPR